MPYGLFLFKMLILPSAVCLWSMALLNGCVIKTLSSEDTAALPNTPQSNYSAPKGIYHRIEKKQTLWSIAKMYSVSLDDLAFFNNITDPSQIKEGQLLFIPDTLNPRAPASQETSAEDFAWPVKKEVYRKNKAGFTFIRNRGINITVSPDTDIIACRSGTIAFESENLRGYGKTIILGHSDGFLTVYSMLSQILVKPGEYVKQGMPIAKAKGTKFYFEIRKGFVAQNPFFYLPKA